MMDDDSFVASPKSFLKVRSNGLLLSDEDILVLEEYGIDYLQCKSLEELIFVISNTINNSSDDCVSLEELNIKLGEYNYYNYTKK